MHHHDLHADLQTLANGVDQRGAAAYEELKARGVEFLEPPEERPYGIDSGFRDPSGNSIRLTQVREMAGL